MDDVDRELERSIGSEQLSHLLDEGVEAAFTGTDVGADLAEQVLPEIPIVKLFYGAVKISRGISDAFLAKKIVRFLSQLSEIDPEERQKFLANLESDDRERVVENLMLVLQKHEALQKSEIQGRLFAALIKGDLNRQEYYRLTHATSTINAQTFPDLAGFYSGKLAVGELSIGLLYSFAFLELVALDNSKLGTFGGGQPEFHKTELGARYVDLLRR